MNALALGMIAAVVGYAGCDNGATTTTTGASANVTNGTGYHPGCNGGVPDGFCNALGADPETCACRDCVETAYCKGGCKNDGVCGAGEDCTCIDCVGKSVPDGMGGKVTCYAKGSSGPATSSAAGGGSGPATAASTTKAATNAASTTQAATTAASTTAATTAASTTASTTGAGG